MIIEASMKEIIDIMMVAFCLLFVISAVSANETGFTLGIYGNANMDQIIDESDIVYVEEIISGTRESTDLADANYDGSVNELDLDQIKKIIAGTEENLTIVDSSKRVATIKKPVRRIVSISIYNNEALRMFGELDKMVAIEDSTKKKDVFFPQGAEMPSIGGYPPNPEAIFKYQPDLLLGCLLYTSDAADE